MQSPYSALRERWTAGDRDRREDAEQFIARVKRDDPQLAAHLRVVERELEAGGRN